MQYYRSSGMPENTQCNYKSNVVYLVAQKKTSSETGCLKTCCFTVDEIVLHARFAQMGNWRCRGHVCLQMMTRSYSCLPN